MIAFTCLNCNSKQYASVDNGAPCVDCGSPSVVEVDSEYGITSVDLASAEDGSITHLELNPYEHYVMCFAVNRGISVEEASSRPICKARLDYFNKTRL